MVALEDRFQTRIDEARFAEAASVADLKQLVEQPPAADDVDEPVDFPTWNRTLAGAARPAPVAGHVDPAADARCSRTRASKACEHLQALDGPGRLRVEPSEPHGRAGDPGGAARPLARARRAGDAQGVLQGALLPGASTRWRQWFTNSLNYYLACFYFNAFPLPQREAGARHTLQYIGELTGERLVDPDLSRKGVRSTTGDIKPFRGGIGMIASRLDVPVVPVRLDGVDRVLPIGVARSSGPGAVRVAFGAPLRLRGDDYAALARQVEERGASAVTSVARWTVCDDRRRQF